MRALVIIVTAASLCGFGLGGPARAKEASDATCPAKQRTVKRVYGIGSSTMGMDLGRILKDELRSMGANVRIWGKASSGLARPDFHDWPAAMPKIVKAHRPDVFVVSLGTNDAQNLFHKGHWYEFGSRHWKRVYRERIDRLLTVLSGPKKARPVVWLGPTTLPGEKGHARVKLIASLIRERTEAFGGPVRFIDGVARTTDKKGRPLKRVKVPGRKQLAKARASDNVHLTQAGVRWLLAEPILKTLAPCFTRTAKAGGSRLATSR